MGGNKKVYESSDGMNAQSLEAILRHPRSFLTNRFVYAVISQRAGGLSIGINMNPDQACNFDCVYCEVKRTGTHQGERVDIEVMSKELKNLLALLQLGKFHQLNGFTEIPKELLILKMVALSGDGEPTLCPNFFEIIQEVVRIRQNRQFPLFKMVLITNATGLHLPSVQKGLGLFTESDEIWAKLDVGTQAYMEKINCAHLPLEKVLANILLVGRQRPIIIQSLFCSLDGKEPSDPEIEAYVQRLLELKNKGVKIILIQIYSVVREPAHKDCLPLPLARLSYIARCVRKITGLRTEVY